MFPFPLLIPSLCFTHSSQSYLFYFISLFISFHYSFLSERQTMSRGGTGERGRHRIWSRLQALSCQHRAQHGAWTNKLWDYDLSWSWTLNQLSHPGAPLQLCYDEISLTILFCLKYLYQMDLIFLIIVQHSKSCQFIGIQDTRHSAQGN